MVDDGEFFLSSPAEADVGRGRSIIGSQGATSFVRWPGAPSDGCGQQKRNDVHIYTYPQMEASMGRERYSIYNYIYIYIIIYYNYIIIILYYIYRKTYIYQRWIFQTMFESLRT
jgi:hypothetical protein